MIAERKTSLGMLVLLTLLIFVYNLSAGFYFAGGLEPSPTFAFLYDCAFISGVVWWLRAEASRSAVTPIYCQGLLVGIGWLIVIPYHLVKTRGLRGLLPLLALIGSFVLGETLGAVLHFVFST